MLGRRKQDTDTTVVTTLPDVEDQASPGKGRPTPKRREAQASRKAVVKAPTNRRESAKLARERVRKERADARSALLRGDERALPARDRGPVRRFARDVVDSRRNVAEYLLPFVLVVFAISIYPNVRVQTVTSLLMFSAMMLAIIDSWFMVRSLRRRAAERFPHEDLSRIGRYALMRSTQIRRLRLPKPKVGRGESI